MTPEPMTSPSSNDPSDHTPNELQTGSRLVSSMKKLIPVIALAIGCVAAFWLLETGPKAIPRKGKRTAAVVEVTPLVYDVHKTVVYAMGTVVPAQVIDLKARVSGEIKEIAEDFAPGGFFRKGDTILKIDPIDYQIMARQLMGDVAKAEANLKIEEGNQLIAKREYELLGESVSKEELDLILRQPQLASIRASLDTARAKLEKARLDVQRTTVSSPFNAVVESRLVNVGSQVTSSTTLARLIGTDEFWIELSVPTNQLKWIQIPEDGKEQGSSVKLYDASDSGDHTYRTGRIVRVAAGLEIQGRMARVLVAIPDPFGLDADTGRSHRLLIGSYVRAEIEGDVVSPAAAVSREHIRGNDTIWLMDDQDRLHIQRIDILFRGPEKVLVAEDGYGSKRLIVSDLSAAVEGMPLRLQSEVSVPGEGRTGSGGRKSERKASQ